MFELVVIVIVCSRGPPFHVINAKPISVNLERVAIPMLVERNWSVIVQVSFAKITVFKLTAKTVINL